MIRSGTLTVFTTEVEESEAGELRSLTFSAF